MRSAATLALAVALAACADITAVGDAVVPLEGGSIQAMEQIHFNTREEQERVIANPCTGETVVVRGTFHVVGHVASDESSTHLNFHSNYNAQGVSASGEEYNYIQTHQDIIQTQTESGFTVVVIDNMLAVSRGPSPNYIEQLRTVFVVRGGEAQHESTRARARCTGRF